MNNDVERLVRDGLDRLAATAKAPAGIFASAQRHNHRRRVAVGSALASGTAAVVAVAVVAATGAAGQQVSPGILHARTEAYVVLQHTARALAEQNRVMFGRSSSRGTGGDKTPTLSTTWSYRDASSFVEFWPGTTRYLDDGTAEIHGKLRTAYVTYFDRKWSGGAPPEQPAPACSKSARLGMGGPAPAVQDWPGFVGTMLGCGDATVTGRVWINGVHTIRIAGRPVRARLPKGMVKQTTTSVQFTLYVDPATYLPVRLSGSTASFGGGAPRYTYSTVTNIQWLPPTAANIARSIVTIPPGFKHVKSAADQ
jgi:hypothetical protein